MQRKTIYFNCQWDSTSPMDLHPTNGQSWPKHAEVLARARQHVSKRTGRVLLFELETKRRTTFSFFGGVSPKKRHSHIDAELPIRDTVFRSSKLGQGYLTKITCSRRHWMSLLLVGSNKIATFGGPKLRGRVQGPQQSWQNRSKGRSVSPRVTSGRLHLRLAAEMLPGGASSSPQVG